MKSMSKLQLADCAGISVKYASNLTSTSVRKLHYQDYPA